jgi:hypothetical protein
MINILTPPRHVFANDGGFRQVFIERRSDGKAQQTSEVFFPPGPYANAV